MNDAEDVSRSLPVSIVAGPSGNSLLEDIVHGEPKCRFGLLVSSNADTQLARNKVMVEQLVAANGGYDPERIKAQIAAIAEKVLVDHLIIECDSKTHPISIASVFFPDDSRRFLEIARLSSILLAVDPKAVLNSIVHGGGV